LLRNVQHCGIISVQESIPGILPLSQSGIRSDSGIASSNTIISSIIHPNDHPVPVRNSGTESMRS
jgi:hypothetical protein